MIIYNDTFIKYICKYHRHFNIVSRSHALKKNKTFQLFNHYNQTVTYK